MRSAPWHRVAGLFHAVVDLGPAEREARIRETAGCDRTLIREVRELVRASGCSGNGDFIAAAVAAMANEMTVARRPEGKGEGEGEEQEEEGDPQRPSSSSRADRAPSSRAASSGRPAAR